MNGCNRVDLSLYPSGLTNYWPILYNTMTDCVTGTAMSSLGTTTYQNDRNSLAKDAIYLNNKFATFPNGIYFSSAFTITAYVKAATSLTSGGMLLDFSLGSNINRIYLTLSYCNPTCNSKIAFVMYDSTGAVSRQLVSTVASAKLSNSAWSFLAITYDGYSINLYVNGVLIDSSTNTTYWMPSSVTRTSNFLGKNYSGSQTSNSYIDQLAFYNRALTSGQITTLNSISYGTSGAN